MNHQRNSWRRIWLSAVSIARSAMACGDRLVPRASCAAIIHPYASSMMTAVAASCEELSGKNISACGRYPSCGIRGIRRLMKTNSRWRLALLWLAQAILLGAAWVGIGGRSNRRGSLASGGHAPALEVGKRDGAERVRVYVYDDSTTALGTTDLVQCYRDRHDGLAPWQDERADMAQDMGEIWLHRAMLDHPWRVLDPEDADLFFVPLYPVLSYKLIGKKDKGCRGLSHGQRMYVAVKHLEQESTYFKRFGGADHVMVCAWWNCRVALGPRHRMLLRRAVIGINEKIQNWANWGCGERMVTVPYTASSVLTARDAFGGLAAAERDIPFFFVGTTRRRPERKNLKVIRELSPNSVIQMGDHGYDWGMDAEVYAAHIIRSRFCFCPRGDTASSRRFFDAVSAGCIPVMTVSEVRALPFKGFGLNYTEFAVVAPKGSLGSAEKVAAVVQDILSRSEEEVARLQEGVKTAAKSVVYGVTTGPELSDMHPFLDTASMFLRAAQAQGGGKHLWGCPPTGLNTQTLSPRTWEKFPPSADSRKQWLCESETFVNTERSLLFCAPPNTGSLQFRMLAKRMQGVAHWAVSDDPALIFDPIASELPLLDVNDKELMDAIYRDNGSGWVKTGVVRDPVTRLVSAYLDLVHNWPLAFSTGSEGSPGRDRSPQGLGGDGEAWFDAFGRAPEEKDGAEGVLLEQDEAREGDKGVQEEEGGGGRGGADALVASRAPTFVELLEVLAVNMSIAPAAFRPMSSLCGTRHSPFDVVIPFETLQETSTEVLKSLPGAIWDTCGAAGWGPDGEHAFMEFDYGGVLRGEGQHGGATTGGDGEKAGSSSVPRRARDFFAGASCAWTEFYADEEILERVLRLYKADYSLYGWYGIDTWRERLRACLEENQ